MAHGRRLRDSQINLHSILVSMNQIFLHTALAAALLVSACATPPDQIRMTPPKVSLNAKPVERVAACFIERYDAIGWSPMMRVTPRSDGGQTLKRIARQVPVGEAYAFVIDVIPRSSGTEVRIYEHQMVTSIDRNIFAACVQ